MTIFISGGAKSGKSSLAQDLTVALANGGRRYYIATMIPMDAEDHDRIRRHIDDRAGMGFETIECGRDLLGALSDADLTGAFLLDSATALLQNAMFPPENNYEMDFEAAKKCADDIVAFARSADNAVIVSDYIYSDACRYDSGTEKYRQCLAGIDRRLAQISDTVLEVSSGQITVHKGSLL